MANSTTMAYGTYNFRPVPIVALNKNYELSEGGDQLGLTVGLTLEGTVVATGADGEALSEHSYVSIDTVQDGLADAIHSQNGNLFLVQCGGTTLISGYPIVRNVSFPPSTNQWVSSSPYTVELEYYEVLHTGIDASGYYVNNATEEWNLEIIEDRKPHVFVAGGNQSGEIEATLSHTVSAVGKSIYNANGLIKPAWEHAKDYVVNRLVEQPDAKFVQVTGVLNLPDYSGFDHVRNSQVGELAGSFSCTETWRLTNNRTAVEDFNITVRSGSQDGLTTVGIDGNVEGLERRIYGSTPGQLHIQETKYEAASGYFSGINVFGRVNGMGIPNLNIIPLTVSVGHNPPQGTISYNYEYNDRPTFCVTDSRVLSEIISINDTNPHDVFAQLAVCGRARGPVLQDISTVTPATREVSVEILYKPTGECDTLSANTAIKDGVTTFLLSVYNDLSNNRGDNAQVFKHQDQESTNISQGRYSRTVGWTYQTDSTTKDGLS